MSFKIADRIIDGRAGKSVYVVAEIGQNHQGDIEIAKRMIVAAKWAGADCVKFQKSSLNEKFTKSALNRCYDGPNSWGRTYGEHKKHLEFNMEQYKMLKYFANEQNIEFTASTMDIQSLRDLIDLRVPVIKIGSGDANNVLLLREAAACATPLIISTGMQTESMVNRIIEIMNASGKKNYCLMHCVSAYPTAAEHVQLRMICAYRKHFPHICVGYSGHEKGTAISCAAVALGAKVIERHFTLDKQQKGTDHKLSLEPIELQQLIKRIRSIENQCGFDDVVDVDDETVFERLTPITLSTLELIEVKMALAPVQRKQIQTCEMECRSKLGKSLVYRVDLTSGTMLSEQNICAKVSEPFGIAAEHFDAFIGKTLAHDVCQDENLSPEHFHN